MCFSLKLELFIVLIVSEYRILMGKVTFACLENRTTDPIHWTREIISWVHIWEKANLSLRKKNELFSKSCFFLAKFGRY